MDINSKEFEKKYKHLIKDGYCKKCIAILISPYTLSGMCEKCKNLFDKLMEKITCRN